MGNDRDGQFIWERGLDIAIARLVGRAKAGPYTPAGAVDPRPQARGWVTSQRVGACFSTPRARATALCQSEVSCPFLSSALARPHLFPPAASSGPSNRTRTNSSCSYLHLLHLQGWRASNISIKHPRSSCAVYRALPSSREMTIWKNLAAKCADTPTCNATRGGSNCLGDSEGDGVI